MFVTNILFPFYSLINIKSTPSHLENKQDNPLTDGLI